MVFKHSVGQAKYTGDQMSPEITVCHRFALRTVMGDGDGVCALGSQSSSSAICQGTAFVDGETVRFRASRGKSVPGETVVRVGVTESDKMAWLGHGPEFGLFQLVSNLSAAAGPAGLPRLPIKLWETPLESWPLRQPASLVGWGAVLVC